MGDSGKAQPIEQRTQLAILAYFDSMGRKLVRRGRQAVEHGPGGFAGRLVRMEISGLRGRDEAEITAQRGQTLIGIVGPKAKAILGATGKHAIWLCYAVRGEIVDHHADIGLGAIDDELGQRQRGCGSVSAGHKALCSGLLITGGAVDLAGEEQSWHILRGKAGRQCPRIDMIILNGITGPQDASAFQALDRGDELFLHMQRQRR